MLQPIANMMRMRAPPPQRPPLVGPHMTGPHPHNSMPDMAADNMPGHKSSGTMDSQYMQQQSQIFVFTTRLANSAAEAVDSGTFGSIVDFHCSNPETKKLLDKYPLKPQLNRNNSSAIWLNSLAQRQGPRPLKAMHPSGLKNSFGPPVRGQMANSCVGSCNMHTPSGPGPGGGMTGNWPNNGNMCSGANWSAQSQAMFAQNFQSDDPNHKFMNSSMPPNGAIARHCAPFAPNHQNNQMNNQFVNSCPPHMAGEYNGSSCLTRTNHLSDLSDPIALGAEIPEENLTPQQKQHREKQLAIIRKMQQQLCPEMMDSPPMAPHMMVRMPGMNHPMNAPDFMIDQNSVCSSNTCPMPESDHFSGGDCITPSSMMSSQSNGNNMSVEWSKGNFVEERRRKSQTCGQSTPVPTSISHASPVSQPPSQLNSPSPMVSASPGPGARIPPPPYNQGIRPHSSPHPSSPATTASLPLASPRTQSPATNSGPASTSRAQTPVTSRAPTPSTGSVTQPSPRTQSPLQAGVGTMSMGSPRTKCSSPTPASVASGSPQTHSPNPHNDGSRHAQSRVTHTSPSPESNGGTSGTTGTTVTTGQSPKPGPTPLATSSTVVPLQLSRTNMKSTTPSTTVLPNSSPSNVKKVPNLMPPKGMGPECGSELLMHPMTHSAIDQKPCPNDFGPLRTTLPNNCSSPFMCKPEPALMPVPSPQQIQYLNAFEGQELTIQKQPNISLRDTDLISPAPDLDLGFSPEFSNNCQPFGANFQMMDGVNPRFGSNLNGNQFGSNPRFISPESNQRFASPVFDGPRMPNPDNQFRPQNVCMPYNQMNSNMMRFNGPCDSRIRGGPPNEMAVRFGPPNEQFNRTKSPMSSDQMNPNMMFPMNQCFNQQMDASVSSTHLQNLQKMTPPFDMGPGSGPGQGPTNGVHPHTHNHNSQLLQGSNGSMSGMPPNQRNSFDPISSMAAMTEPNPSNPMASHNAMSSMQVAANGPPPGPPGPPTMVNFHTNMSSMQGMHQNMTSDSNGMQSPFSVNAQMNPQMSGGPQTVNNTYVNATMSIQQLNIQNVPTPNFNPNMDQSMQQMQPVPATGPNMGSPSPMQMMQPNPSAKMGPNFAGHMSGPQSGSNFVNQQIPNPRGMNPNMNFGGNPNSHMGQRCPSYNSANIQIKPDAPNTIQYLPRQQNQSMSSRPPSLDFLQRCEPPLTNLGNKLPTHNLQYFPTNSSNMSPTMPMGSRIITQNMAMARPVNQSMARGPGPGHGHSHGSGMMPGPEMFARPSGPPGPPNAMFSSMKPPNGPVSPGGMGSDGAQALPPSLAHSYNYKQNSFNALSVQSDPNYAIQYQHFQQQLYATNTNRGPNSGNNAANGPRMAAQNNFYNSSK